MLGPGLPVSKNQGPAGERTTGEGAGMRRQATRARICSHYPGNSPTDQERTRCRYSPHLPGAGRFCTLNGVGEFSQLYRLK